MTALGWQGKLEEADELLLRAIGIQEKTLGPDDWRLADSLSIRANVLHVQVNGLDIFTLMQEIVE